MSGLVVVIGKQNFIGIAGKQMRHLPRESRSEAGYRIGEAGLMQRNGVHIALNQNQRPLL